MWHFWGRRLVIRIRWDFSYFFFYFVWKSFELERGSRDDYGSYKSEFLYCYIHPLFERFFANIWISWGFCFVLRGRRYTYTTLDHALVWKEKLHGSNFADHLIGLCSLFLTGFVFCYFSFSPLVEPSLQFWSSISLFLFSIFLTSNFSLSCTNEPLRPLLQPH